MTQCTTNTKGDNCLPGMGYDPLTCKPWNITEQSKTNCLVNAYQQETLGIAGANINVYKLLGAYEQLLLVDLVGNGSAISSGDEPNYPAKEAYSKTRTQWVSTHSGDGVTMSSYIGYDFGEIKTINDRLRYGIDTSVRYQIATIKIKQGQFSKNRVTKARVERSEDGFNWYGVSIINLPDNDQLNTISFKQSVPNRYWRIRPVLFNGGECDSWMVQALELHEFINTSLDNYDPILLESRDRNYATTPILLRGFYDLISPNTDLTRFGFELPSLSYQIKINFDACIILLGRPIVIGDILELPSEIQYTPDLIPIKKYLEVTDITWDSSTYTPGWQPTMLLVTALPAMASQETQDIFGDLATKRDNLGSLDNDIGGSHIYQDFIDISQTINQTALNMLPERGSDSANVIRQFEPETLDAANSLNIPISKLGLDPIALYVESAIPPNGAQYTEDSVFPAAPNNGDYHRLTYVGLSKDVPARLYRYSTNKSRWVYLETDRRNQFNNQKSILEDYLVSPNNIPPRDIR